MDDKRIIELFYERSEKAIEETAKKYGKYIFHIANDLLKNDADAEEVVNDTYLRMWNNIPPAVPEPLKGYIATVAKRLALNRLRDRERAKRFGGISSEALDELSEILSGKEDDPIDTYALRDALNSFLASLNTKTRDIFVRRYWYAAPVKEIADEFGMTENNIAVLMLRTRNKLKKFLKKEGFEP